jgi:hypothetical protein
MSEGRVVILVLGLFAALMIGFPVATVLFAARPNPAQGDDGAISQAFLQASSMARAPQPVQSGAEAAEPALTTAIASLLPRGMAEKAVFDAFAASGFTCATDANAATCFRSYAAARCRDDWKVRVIFSDDGTVWSDKAERGADCS